MICANLRLEILLRPSFDPFQRFLQVLERIGNAEPQVAFSVGAEGGAAKPGHACLLEQRVGHFLGSPAGGPDAGESVKSAFGNTAMEARDLIDPLHKVIAAPLELTAHVLD